MDWSTSSIVLLGIAIFNPGLAATQPNIIFILADDLGYNDVSWHNPSIVSPNLERLAREGVIMEQSYVLPLCTPTR